MNNKGFTLVELLAVIIILSLLTLLVSSSVTKIVSDSRTDLYDTQINLIKSAAESWGADNIYSLPNSGECAYLTLEDLKEYGLLDSSIINPKTNEEFDDKMKIKITTTSSKYDTTIVNYEVDPDLDSVKNCEPAYGPICTAVTEETKTTGNVPSGNYNLGDEYLCEVKDGTNYTFFVLSVEEDKVNLIMDSDVNADGEPIKSSEATDLGLTSWYGTIFNTIQYDVYSGPIDAMDYLNNATSNWKNITKINKTYDDEKGRYTDFVVNSRARMPKISEASGVGCGFHSDDNEETLATCPIWMYNYLSTTDTTNNLVTETSIKGYWLMDTTSSNMGQSSDDYDKLAQIIDYSGNMNHFYVEYKFGVRPVISVDKTRIQG